MACEGVDCGSHALWSSPLILSSPDWVITPSLDGNRHSACYDRLGCLYVMAACNDHIPESLSRNGAIDFPEAN